LQKFVLWPAALRPAGGAAPGYNKIKSVKSPLHLVHTSGCNLSFSFIRKLANLAPATNGPQTSMTVFSCDSWAFSLDPGQETKIAKESRLGPCP